MKKIALLLGCLVVGASAISAQSATKQLQSADLSSLQWRNIGPARPSGRVTDLAVLESRPSTFYVATATGGAWKTTTNGTTWTPVWDSEGSISLGAIAVAPSNPDVVWVGTGEAWSARISSYGDGVYKSEDGGKTWHHMGLRETRYIGRIAIHPQDENTVYVAALGSLWGPNEERGLFKTTNGGKSWTKMLYKNPHTGAVEVALAPSRPETVYAATYLRERRAWNFVGGGPENGLYKSIDGGESWVELTNGLPEVDMGRIGLSICRSQPSTIYTAIEAQRDAGGIFRSDDRGASWERRTGKWNTRLDYGKLNCDPNDPESLWLMHMRLSRSDDGGETFRTDVVGRGGHADWRTMWINPTNSDHLISGSDGGVYLSYDRGKSWSFIGNLPVSQFYDVAVDMQEPFYYVYGGLQDNGTFGGPSGTRYSDGITNADWKLTTGGDGFYVQIDPQDPTIVYSEWQYGFLNRFDTRTGERHFIQPQPPEKENYRWNWSSPLVLSQHDRKTLYFGANYLFRSRNRGDSWETIGPDLTRNLNPHELPLMGNVWPKDAVAYHAGTADYGSISTIAESPLRAGVLAVGTDDGLIQVTTDDGENWFRVGTIPGVPNQAWVTRVVLSGHDEQTLYATIDAHHDNDFRPYVVKSADLGRTWKSITANLPEFGHARTLAEHPRNPNLLFVGTEFGVFLSLDGGNRWVRLKNNLPTVNIYDILIHPRENDLVIATHGRGLWILDDIGILESVGQAWGKELHVASVRPATQLHRYTRNQGSIGTDHFSAPNPPDGATITYYVNPSSLEGDGGKRVEVDILGAGGEFVRRLHTNQGQAGGGIRRLIWDLRHPLPYDITPEEARNSWQPPPRGAFVIPGEYRVRLRLGDEEVSQSITVRGDPAISISTGNRRLWHDTLLRLAEMDAAARGSVATAQQVQEQLKEIAKVLASNPNTAATLGEELRSLQSQVDGILDNLLGRGPRDVAEQPKAPPIARRIRETYAFVEASTARPTDDQLRITEETGKRLSVEVARIDRLVVETIPAFNRKLDTLGVRWTPGRSPGVRTTTQ